MKTFKFLKLQMVFLLFPFNRYMVEFYSDYNIADVSNVL